MTSDQAYPDLEAQTIRISKILTKKGNPPNQTMAIFFLQCSPKTIGCDAGRERERGESAKMSEQ